MHSFPKIFQLGTVYVSDIFKEEVEITEKIDGSHFRFMLNKDGELITYGRQAQVFMEKADGLFEPVMHWVHSIKHKLKKGNVYYGETLCRPRHNTLAYTKVPTNNFCLFGMSSHENTYFHPHNELKEIAEDLECDFIPLLFSGKIEDSSLVSGGLSSIVDHYLKEDSYLGGCKIEGIVIKNYNRLAHIGGITMPIMCSKYVSEAFKEHHKANKEFMPQTDKVELAFASCRTEARWRKAIQHLHENGELEHTPRDIGKLMKEINLDIIKDQKQEILEELWHIFSKKYQGYWTHGFPEFYKKFLLENKEKNSVEIA